jgi:hypothetical protein
MSVKMGTMYKMLQLHSAQTSKIQQTLMKTQRISKVIGGLNKLVC